MRRRIMMKMILSSSPLSVFVTQALVLNPRHCFSFSPCHSTLELKWFNNIGSWQNSSPDWGLACEKAREDSLLYKDWIDYNKKENRVLPRPGGRPAVADEKIFSKQTFKDSCTGETIDHYVEPLATLLRHPYTSCFHEKTTNKTKPKFTMIFNTKWLLFPEINQVHRLAPSGKKLFFDLGTYDFSKGVPGYGCSLLWFQDAYEQRGVVFDQIYSWEARQMDHVEFWGTVPEKHAMKLVYYNYPAGTEIGHSHNPLTHIKAKCRKEDYCVFKVDIDTTKVEEEIIKQIVEDPSVAELIDELFWEHHVFMHPLANNKVWVNTKAHPMDKTRTIKDSYDIFTKLRRLGIRAHSWV